MHEIFEIVTSRRDRVVCCRKLHSVKERRTVRVHWRYSLESNQTITKSIMLKCRFNYVLHMLPLHIQKIKSNKPTETKFDTYILKKHFTEFIEKERCSLKFLIYFQNTEKLKISLFFSPNTLRFILKLLDSTVDFFSDSAEMAEIKIHSTCC